MLSRLAGALAAGQQVRRLKLEALSSAGPLAAPDRLLLEPRRLDLRQLDERLRAAMPGVLQRERNRLNALDASLRALNPASVLDRGYAMVRGKRGIVDRAAGVSPRDSVRIVFSDGEVDAEITGVQPMGE